jgi:hypothetical protein
LAGCLCGCRIRAKIGKSGYHEFTVVIIVADDHSGATAGCRAASHFVAWSKNQSKSGIRFSKTRNKGPTGGDLGERL